MGGKCDYNNSVEKFEQDSQSGPAPDRRINTMANCAIVGINWGDEGKGRMVDYLTDHYDVVVRYQGGGNAGHTVVNEKGKFALHLLPSGIFRDGVVNILGNGVALDCENLLKEMETLRAAGVIITPENLKVSDRASLLLPWHRELDALEEARLADKKYGSTKQGIAPFYGDKYQKKTVQAGELLHPEHLKEHLADLLEWKNLMLQKIYGAKGYTMDELMAWVDTYCGAIKPYITDTGRFLRNAQREGKSILFEAQLGALRDLDYGIYPYTTSSNAVAAYAPVGSGLPTAKLDEVVGVVKAYSSCVGEGPFVCEWFGEGAQQLRDAGDLPDDHPTFRLEAHYLAQMCVNLILTVSPQRIVLGGGVMQREGLFPLVRQETLRLLGGYVQSDRLLNHTDDYIVPPALYPVSGLWGAYLLGKKALENA